MTVDNQPSYPVPTAQEAGVSQQSKSLFPPATTATTAPSSRSVSPALSSSRHSLNAFSTATASTATTTASSSDGGFEEEEEADREHSLAPSVSDLEDASTSNKKRSQHVLFQQQKQNQRVLKRFVGPLSYGPLPVASLAELDASSQPAPSPTPSPAPWVSIWQTRFLQADARRKGYREQCPWATVYNARPVTKTTTQKADRDEGVPPRVGMSPIVFGAGTFGTGQYAQEDQIMSIEPVRGEPWFSHRTETLPKSLTCYWFQSSAPSCIPVLHQHL